MAAKRLEFLLEETVKSLSKRLLDDQYPIGKKIDFADDPVIDQLLFHILCDLLVSRTSYSKMVSELIDAKTEVQNAFDKELRSRVYDALYEVQGGLR
jgi:hypothetical protein